MTDRDWCNAQPDAAELNEAFDLAQASGSVTRSTIALLIHKLQDARASAAEAIPRRSHCERRWWTANRVCQLPAGHEGDCDWRAEADAPCATCGHSHSHHCWNQCMVGSKAPDPFCDCRKFVAISNISPQSEKSNG